MSVATVEPEVSVTELDEPLDEDPPRCRVVSVLEVKIINFRWSGNEHGCGKRARAMLLVQCTEHGPRGLPLCRGHLRWLKTGRVKVCCYVCGKPASWQDRGRF